jgi:signal transduction histidine kinase
VHPAVLIASITLGAAAAMAVSIALQREKGRFHWLALSLLVGLLLWTSGVVLCFSATDVAGLRVALNLTFAGVLVTAPCWLLLAAHYASARFMVGWRAPSVALLVPAGLFYFALLTNDGHRLFLREISFEAMAAGPAVLGGPLFWVFIAWGYLYITGGMLLYLGTARRMLAGASRRRGLLLALASALPLFSSALYLAQLVPTRFDLTPVALCISFAMMSVAAFRYELLESVPLARQGVIARLEDGVVMANGAGAVVDLNPAARRILEHPAERVLGMSLSELLRDLADERDGPPLAALVKMVMRDAPGESLEVRTVDQRCIEVFVSGVRSAKGAPAGVFAILRDRSDERHFERIVQQTQRLETVGTLAAGIAHEVNSPLAFVRANLAHIERMGDAVEDAVDGPDAKLAGEVADLRQIARETLDGVERIAYIAADLRRLAAGHEEVRAAVDLSEVARDALRLMQLGPDSSPRALTRFAAALPSVEASGERLMQVVLNLVVNAQHALADQPDGTILLETRSDGLWVELIVDDNGPGVSEVVQDRIFDPFFTTKGPGEGMGLGLSVAFDIARDHGGVIEECARPGPGARFALRLPALRDDSGGAGRKV